MILKYSRNTIFGQMKLKNIEKNQQNIKMSNNSEEKYWKKLQSW